MPNRYSDVDAPLTVLPLYVNVRTKEIVKELVAPERGDGRRNVRYSPDGRYLVFGVHRVVIYDSKTFEVFRTLDVPFKGQRRPLSINVGAVTISPKNDVVAILYRGLDSGYGIAVFSLPSGTLMWKAVLPRPTYLSNAPLVIDKTGTSILCAAGGLSYNDANELKRQADLLAFDVKTGAMRTLISNVAPDIPTAMALSADGRYLAIGTASGSIDQMLNRKTHQFVTLRSGDTINIFSPATGNLLQTIPAHATVLSLDFDGDKLLVNQFDLRRSDDITIHDVRTRVLVQSFPIGAAISLEINPMDGSLATIGGRGAFVFSRKH